MGNLYNRKFYWCKICGKKHFAKGYCHYHYICYLRGRPFQYQKCLIKNCGSKVYQSHTLGLCSFHYPKYLARQRKGLIIQIQKDMELPNISTGGKWGYKNYRLIQKIKKNKCEMCGSKKSLKLHHQDNNKRNSSKQNLITLCNKCHGKLHSGRKNKTSKFKRFIRKTLDELAKKFDVTPPTIWNWLKIHKNMRGFKKRKRGRPRK